MGDIVVESRDCAHAGCNESGSAGYLSDEEIIVDSRSLRLVMPLTTVRRRCWRDSGQVHSLLPSDETSPQAELRD